MKKIFKSNIYTLVFALIVFTSCEENFLDINDDPNNPLSVPTAQLITAAETNLSYTMSNGSGG
ncbi:MAG: SusD/RagB family nutrient-binding outer membrane lipoprotein, partial [Fulvivirga sp.]